MAEAKPTMAALLAVTATPGSGAPSVSVMVPVILDVPI